MSKLSKEELDTLNDRFEYKNLMHRYKVMEEYFDIQEGDIVIDGGAFHGDMAQYFSKKVGDTGTVHSFEALNNNYRYLRNFIRRYKLNNVKLYPIALWDKREKIRFYLSEYSNAGSPLREFRKVSDNYTEVDGDKLDNLVDKVDYIWTNIEGSEINFLKGAKQTLLDNDCKVIISCHRIKDDYYSMPEVISILESYGYKCKRLGKKPNIGWVYACKQ